MRSYFLQSKRICYEKPFFKRLTCKKWGQIGKKINSIELLPQFLGRWP